MSRQIELLGPDDGLRLRRLRLRALADAPDAFGSTLEESEARPLSSWTRQLRDLPTFVAVIDGQDVGMVRGGPDPTDDRTAWLLSMWVAPSARGTGTGDALVDVVIAWARAEGFHRLVLDVADDNHHAVALYARKGFLPTGQTGTLPPPRQHVTEHQRVLDLVTAGG